MSRTGEASILGDPLFTAQKAHVSPSATIEQRKVPDFP
jgi:hypothetical protein